MDLAAFQGLLEQNGTDLDRWPDASRAAALEILAGSTEAREAYVAAFPGPADQPRAAEGDDALVERIMQAVARDVR
ncbi:MAG TPA: hypothetical protein VJS38_17100 [Phenylobacterium sp.]|uniref:hypothetical protein n=1 Tax=Phenylobacterium sp. TaxID=1871053 RepID=UPI002B45DBD5|nr:hypothetical protein [Phenylobacterium sp.]HKR89889.1 hypothetical protein [Phenylobacterium sp.]